MVFKFNLNDCDKDTTITRLLLLNPIDTDLVIPTNVSVKENFYSSNIDIRSLSIEIIIEWWFYSEYAESIASNDHNQNNIRLRRK